MNNETMTLTVDVALCMNKCPAQYLGYFGLQETNVMLLFEKKKIKHELMFQIIVLYGSQSGMRCTCIKSPNQLKRIELRECNMLCKSAPRRICGGSGKLMSVYSMGNTSLTLEQ